MTEVERIDDQMERAFREDAWHGPAVQEVLEGVTAEQAARRPIAAAHSIWELVLHMATWKDVVARRLGGEALTDVPPEMDFPKVVDTSPGAWRTALDGLSAAHARLRAVLREIRDDQLDQASAQGLSKRYIQLHGIIQHDLYHAGQIAVLKKG